MAPNSTMASLSHDAILDVLRRLGVKDLLRFRCISKPLCSSIDDPYFRKLHLAHSLETSNNLSLIFRTIKPCNSPSFDFVECPLLSVDFDSMKTPKILSHPFDEDDEGNYTEVVGSCNGLLALFNTEQSSLWNPSTRKSLKLPRTGMAYPPYAYHCKSLVFGLGYDPISDDYKFVRIIQTDTFESEVKVYSLRTNSWRRIKDFPFYLKYERIPAVLASNSLHWVVSKTPDSNPGFVVALDLGTEEYRVVELPDRLDNCFNMINAMGGCLCLIAHYRKEARSADIWIMKEYGVKESWTNLISLKLSESIPYFVVVFPLVFSKNGDKVLLQIGGDSNKLFWYDIKSKRVDEVRIGGLPSMFEVQMFVESLVPLDGNRATINKTKQINEKRQKKKGKRDDFLSKGFHLVL